MPSTPFRLAVPFLAAFIPAAAHAEVRPNIKPGLWETTVTIAMDGLPGMPAGMENMPPQQRAQMETAIKRMSQPQTEKSCITAEQVKKGPDFGEAEPSCKRNISVSSATEWGMTEECTGDRPRKAKTAFKAVNPETISGQSDATMTSPRGETMTSKATFKGKWLGSDCGNIKPMEAPKNN